MPITRRNGEVSLNLKNIVQNVVEKRLVLFPGAADASEGLVCLDGDNSPWGNKSAAEVLAGEKAEVEATTFTEKQSTAGYWAVAPGCADISEGMVWVAALEKIKRAGRVAA